MWTLRAVAEHMGFAGNHPKFVGSGAAVAEELVGFAGQADLDGYAVADAISPGTIDDFVEFVAPHLRERGAITERPGTPAILRERFGGGPRLSHDHPGAAFRDLGRKSLRDV